MFATYITSKQIQEAQKHEQQNVESASNVLHCTLRQKNLEGNISVFS